MDELNERQKRFCELIVGGETATGAYFGAFPRCRSERTARSEGGRLRRRPDVAAHIEKLSAEAREAAKSKLVMSQREALEYLSAIVWTPAGEVEKESPLCQSYRSTEKGTEVRMPCKLKALEKLMKMQGCEVPKEEIDPLTQLLLDIRSRHSQPAGGAERRDQAADFR